MGNGSEIDGPVSGHKRPADTGGLKSMGSVLKRLVTVSGAWKIVHTCVGATAGERGVIERDFDASMRKPSLALDGDIVLRDGEWRMPETVHQCCFPKI